MYKRTNPTVLDHKTQQSRYAVLYLLGIRQNRFILLIYMFFIKCTLNYRIYGYKRSFLI